MPVSPYASSWTCCRLPQFMPASAFRTSKAPQGLAADGLRLGSGRGVCSRHRKIADRTAVALAAVGRTMEGMEALVDELLLARGVARDDLARHRDPRIRDFLPDPSSFKDMDKGAKRLADAVQGGEMVAIFGDYDVDGATSAALLTLLLRRSGPSRSSTSRTG